MTEGDIEGLAGTKEGCDDDVEFVTVERPPPPSGTAASSAGSAALRNGGQQRDTVGEPAAGAVGAVAVHSSELMQSLSSTTLALGHPAEVALEWVQVSQSRDMAPRTSDGAAVSCCKKVLHL